MFSRLGAASLWSDDFTDPGGGVLAGSVSLWLPTVFDKEFSSSLKSPSGPYRLGAEPAAVPAHWSLPEGLFVLEARPFCPTQTDVQPLGFHVGSCKPPMCTGLYSYGGTTVMAVQGAIHM